MMWFSGAPINLQQFEADYWRKQPVYLGNEATLGEIGSQITLERLLGLCADELVESRILANSSNSADQYSVEFGPFDFDRLPERSMLMVQGLESHLPLVSNLLRDNFPFIPRWRIDDVMATYANAGMSCGAHFDHYDVFLIQIRGTKQWQLDAGGHVDSDLSTQAEIRLLDQFTATEHFEQKKGDILYIPPGYGHWGIASDDSLTLSVGIRNPTLQEMISHLADAFGDELQATETLDDSLSSGSALISGETTRSVTSRMADALLTPSLTQEWFGSYMTELREPDLIEPPTEEMSLAQGEKILSTASVFVCHLATRLAFQSVDKEILIFINGLCLHAETETLKWLKKLESNRMVDAELISPTRENIEVLTYLLNLGAISVLNPETQDSHRR